jgi:hypothetical protein
VRLFFESFDPIQSALIEEWLDSEEIPFVKQGGYLNALAGGIPFSESQIQIFIPESVFEYAKQALAVSDTNERSKP